MKKKIISFMFIVSMLLLSASSVLALGGGEGYYYAFDDFRFYSHGQAKETSSSYDSFTTGGSVSQGTIYDGSENAPVKYRRKTNNMTGNIVWELGFKSTTLPEGTTFNLLCEDKNAITLKVIDGKLNVVTTTGKIPVYGEDGFYGIKAFVDINSNKYTLLVNGVTVVENTKFLNNVSYLNCFCVNTSDEGTGAITLENMRLYTDYCVNEWFLTSRSKIPDYFTVIGNGCSISNENISVPTDMYGLCIDDTSYISETGISKNFTYDTDGLWVDFDFFTEGKAKDFGAILSSQGNEVVKFGLENLDYGYWQDGNFVSLYKLKSNLWYNAMIKITDGKAKLYINHKLLKDDIEVNNVKLDNIKLAVGKVATGKVYVDSIMVKGMNSSLPADYPSAPLKPADKSNIYVGTQSCSLWREGIQMGWDSLNGYKNRTPYLGYFDEGSTEVADWETKWMVEHGIDFQMYCWFRQGSNDKPIQRPIDAYALNEGFLNSEYKKDLKFCLMWENQNATKCSGYDDFMKNIVPYWIEYYFKDESYLVIDNKPVISYFSVDQLYNSFGSAEGVKAAFKGLSDACKAEGFDGVYTLLQISREQNEKRMKKIEDLEPDALFNYSLYAVEAGPQIDLLKKQNEVATVPIIASPGIGFNNDAWGEATVTGYSTAEQFQNTLQRIKNEYMPTQKGLGAKMVTLDNWNEYSEGHAFAPSNLTGFGYVDAIRDVFTDGGGHEDERPSENSQNRIQHLYIQTRERPKSLATMARDYNKDQMSNYVDVKKITFNDGDSAENYPIEKQIDNYRIENGALCGTATDNDPGLHIPNVNINGGDVKQIVIRMKTNKHDGNMQMFFITKSDPNWDEGKSFRATISSDNEFIDIVLDTSSSSTKMDGLVTEIRIDPMEESGEFEIESVTLRGPDPSSVVSYSIDGNKQSLVRNIKIKEDRMYVPASEAVNALGYRSDPTFDGKYIELFNIETEQVIKLEIGKHAFEEENDIYIPLRYISEAAGYNVGWDNENRCANIITSDESDSTIQTEDDPKGTFNFNTPGDFQGMSTFASISGQKVSKGILSLTATTTDPNMRGSLGIDAEQYPYCNIRVKNKSQGTLFQIFFTTESDSSWSEDKSAYIYMSLADKEFKTYTLNMSDNVKWKGKIPNLRIDPTNNIGDIQIDYIIFSDKPMTDSDVVSDSAISGTNILKGGTMDKKELAYTKSDLDVSYAEEESYIGQYSLKLCANDDKGIIRFPVDIKDNGKYGVSAVVKTSDAGNFKIGYYNSENSSEYGDTIVKELAPGWTKIEMMLPDDSSGVDGIYIKPSKGTFYLDNLMVLEKLSEKDKNTQKFKERKEPKSGAKKILIIGNSITQHEYADSLGWYGTWGMAATSEDKDYVHRLESMISEKEKNVKFMVVNVWDFERYFYDLRNIDSVKYKDAVDFDADIIITAFGANINNADNEGDNSFLSGRKFAPEDYMNIVNYFNPYGDAQIVAGMTPLTKSEILKQIKGAATANNLPLVDMTDLTDEKYTARPYANAPVFGSNVSDGVLGHPGDLGMQVMAERYYVEVEKALSNISR